MRTTTTAVQDPTKTGTYDVIVVGAGPVGEATAMRLRAGGLSVALVEAELVGGECHYWACIPSKAMLRPGHARLGALRVPGTREAVTGHLDTAAALARRDEVVDHHDDTRIVRGLGALGVHVVRGRGRLTGPAGVSVSTSAGAQVDLRANHAVVLATGALPALPPVPGLAEARPWTNREATSVHAAPRRLLVMGSGPVGLEMAQAWRSLGSEQVVVLSRGQHLLPEMEPFVGDLVLAGLQEAGVRVRFGVYVERVRRAAPGGEVEAHLNDGSSVVADELLVATGRRASTDDLGLDTIGAQPGAYLQVDPTMQVLQAPGVYAIGDVNGHALMTHQGKYQGRVAADAILARSSGHEPQYTAEADQGAVPQVLFTDPEVATVGLTHQQATQRGLRVSAVEADLGAVPGAMLHAKGYSGRAGLIIDEDTQTLVGATFVGQDVADMVHAATMAIVGHVPLERIRHAVPSFPTLSEVWLDLLDAHARSAADTLAG